MCGGDSPAHVSLAGGLLGVMGGYSKIPLEWTEELRPKQKQFLNVKINQLLDMMGIP